MKDGKLKIPMPDDQEIEMQVSLIVAKGLVKKETFVSVMRSMVQEVGWRHLFADRLQLTVIFTSMVIALYSLLLLTPAGSDVHNLYAAVFLLSPVLFLAFSVFTYVHKASSATYDVEMACKYNVYQVIALRMLAFSGLAVAVNTALIAALAVRYAEFQFGHAFLLSGTSLFLFSFLLTLALQKRRTKGIVIASAIVWVAGNLIVRNASGEFYNVLLLNLPNAVYAAVLIGCLVLYLNHLKKLVDFKQPEGVY